VDDHSDRRATYPKTAACACGALTVGVRAAPNKIHACTCIDCQRRTGTAFSYTAFFAEDATSIAGRYRTWRRIADSGRWTDACFCPECGGTVFIRLEAYPEFVGVPVGCFGDSAFEPPGALYWTIRRHAWLSPPAGMKTYERQ
jgi:hypothetical protein